MDEIQRVAKRFNDTDRFNKDEIKTANNDEQIIGLIKAYRMRSAALVYKKQYGYTIDESIIAVQRMANQHGVKTGNGAIKSVLFVILLALAIVGYSYYTNNF